MIKKQQRWIALLVTLTFMWLLQVSAMPLRASETAAPAVSANSETGPDYYEAIAQKAAPAKKGSILPWVLVGVGVVAVTAVVLFLFVLNKYDITGTWKFTFTYGGASNQFDITFAGDKKSGSFSCIINPNLSGTYSVDGKKVNMILTFSSAIPFSGEFTGKNAMSGSLIEGSATILWTAARL
jgi:hypothetical protein